ncbi:tetratricopeptide repeat protein [Lysobacter enzymogenes]|nr:tetratricopeptide repeat protein [Lysobacter enzymogenes]QCW28073.1 tetratricopeptide repeat protein [Lysobacter enzymogenes]
MTEPRPDLTALLQRAHAAIAQARDVEAVRLLQRVLECDPDNVHAQYLLAIQHAQLGLYDRAEQRLRAVLARLPGFVVARFQLAQLLLMRGIASDARQWLRPVLDAPAPLGDYARALDAAAAGEAARLRLDRGRAAPAAADPGTGRRHGPIARGPARGARKRSGRDLSPDAAGPGRGDLRRKRRG